MAFRSVAELTFSNSSFVLSFEAVLSTVSCTIVFTILLSKLVHCLSVILGFTGFHRPQLLQAFRKYHCETLVAYGTRVS